VPSQITSYGLGTLWGMGLGDSCRDFPWALPCRHSSCHPPVIPWEPVAVVLNLQPTRPIPSATDDSFPADFETSVYWLYHIRRLLHSLQLIIRCQDVQTSQRNPYWILYDAARSVVATDGIRGLLGRGLKTRVVINGAQGLMFSVLWKLFMDV
jgi:hypothetical protein